MILKKVEDFYDEFEKAAGLNKRKGQRIGSAFFALPLYGKIPNVAGEGQTGMGKTIGYLVPVAMARLGYLPELPDFVFKVEEKKFLEKFDSVDDLIMKYAEEKNFDVDLSEIKRSMVKPELGKVYLVTATKMLQNQIVNKDLKSVNSFILQKNGKEINFAVLIGKKNFLCLKKVEELKNQVEKDLEEAVSKKNVNLAELEDIKEFLEMLKEVLEKKITSSDEGLSVFRRKRWSAFEQYLEDFGADVKPAEFFRPKLVWKEFNTPEEFWKTFSRKKIFKTKDASLFSLLSSSQVRKCAGCGHSDFCSYAKDREKLMQADLYIMNYYYFASVFLDILSSLDRQIKIVEKFLGRKVEAWRSEELEKICEEICKVVNGSLDRDEVKKVVVNLLDLKEVYETYLKKAYFIFDEAHVFERDILSANVKSIDLAEFYKSVQRISKRLTDLYPLLEFVSVPKGTASVFLDTLIESQEVLFYKFRIFEKVLKQTMEEMKKRWAENGEVDVSEVAELMLKSLVKEAREGPETYKEELRELVKYTCGVLKLLCFCKDADHKDESFWSSKEEELTKFLEENVNDENFSKTEYKLLSVVLIENYLCEFAREIKRFVQSASEVKKMELSEAFPVGVFLFVRKTPLGRLRSVENDLHSLSDFFASYAVSFLNKMKIMNADEYERIAGKGGFLDTVLFPTWKNFYSWKKSKKLVGDEKIFLDGFTINKISSDVQEFLKSKISWWEDLRKVFTSATIVDSSNFKEGKSFDFFLRSVGLRNVKEDKLQTFVVLSPFNYSENALFYLPEDVPDFEISEGKVAEEWKEYVLEKIKEVPFYTTGGTLVLLTSKEMLFWLYENVKEHYEKNGVELFVQGRNSMKEISEKFGKPGLQRPQVLLGVNLYWQGFDVPGEGLQHVVIPKLPFEEPKSPYNVMVAEKEIDRIVERLVRNKKMSPHKASQIAEKMVFNTITIPRAVLTFRQGMGRLIRTETDKGLVTLLDSRMIKKGYGERFAQFIPMNFTRKAEVVKSFLEKHNIAGPFWGKAQVLEQKASVKRLCVRK